MTYRKYTVSELAKLSKTGYPNTHTHGGIYTSVGVHLGCKRVPENPVLPGISIPVNSRVFIKTKMFQFKFPGY